MPPFEENLPEGQREELEGLVEIVTFHNPESGFCVLKVRVRGMRNPVALTGKAAAVNVGEWVRAGGRWVMDRKHGRQFQADSLEAVLPDSKEGLEKFLGSGLIRGVGPVYAKKLIAKFGLDVIRVIEERSADLEQVEGIGPSRRRQIKNSWTAQKTCREIIAFLMANGVSTARAFRIYKKYGEDAIATVRLDPYCLARDIHGIGFQSADQIAERLGIEKDSILRARAGLSYMLTELSNQGHCGYPKQELLALAHDKLDIPTVTLEEALALEVEETRLLIEPEDDGARWVFLASLANAERETAQRLAELSRGRHPCPGVDVKAAETWVEAKLQIELSPGQRDAFAAAFQHNVLIATGGPGVGKTTLIRAWVRALAAKKLRITLCAPTGRAAKRMAELSGMEAKTIHRLLGMEPATGQFRHHAGHPLETDVLILDETSMIDILLAQALLRAIPANAIVIFVGDVDQLPSVGPGCVLRDMIESQRLPVFHLTRVFRQSQGSLITENAHRINAGEMPHFPQKGAAEWTAGDFHFIPAEDPGHGVELIQRLVRDTLPRRFGFNPMTDVQVLSPMQKGQLGARNLNAALQAVLNPHGAEIERFGWRYRVGDRVMQMENDYDKDVFNGDIGIIQQIHPDDSELVVTYDNRNVPYDFQELDELAPAYAITVHKSQGSEYPCVIIPVHPQHYVMLQRNLLYTAITRGKKQVILVGTERALGIAVRNAHAARRYTALTRRLAAVLPMPGKK